MTGSPRNTRRRQGGFSLFEALIALVILALGALGISFLQVVSLEQSSSTSYRYRALVRGQNLVNRMRINTAAFPFVAGTTASFPYDDYDSTGRCAAPFPGPRCDESATAPATSCTVAELAAYDLHVLGCGSDLVADGVGDDLPDGVLTASCIEPPCTADSQWVVSVSWIDPFTRLAKSGVEDRRSVELLFRP